MKEGLAALNDEDVVLYGRVLDQFGAPVTDATVSGAIGVNNGLRVGTDRVEVRTDASGTFTISGYRGKDMGLRAAKPGYVQATTNTYFVYSLLWPESQRHIPDPRNPVIIKMWKLQGAEPLLGIKQRYRLDYTANPIRFDLLEGKVVPTGGDLEIRVNRPAGIVSQQHPQEWNVQLEAIDGGLAETSAAESAVTFLAPESGYQKVIRVLGDKGSDGTDRFLFLESRAGQLYSKIRFTFRINNSPGDSMYVSLSGVANTNSSRNWEASAP